MQAFDIDFTWHRHKQGYRLKGGRVVAKGDELEWYRPLDDYSTLYKLFADECRSEKGALEFIKKYGPLLTSPGALIETRALGLPTLMSTIGDLVSEVIAQAQSMKKQLTGRTVPQIPLTSIEAVLIPDGSTVRLKLRPSRLIDAIWLQMAQSVSSGRAVRACQRCGTWFEVGPGSRPPRRLDALFCSDQHRIEFNSLARSKKS